MSEDQRNDEILFSAMLQAAKAMKLVHDIAFNLVDQTTEANRESLIKQIAAMAELNFNRACIQVRTLLLSQIDEEVAKKYKQALKDEGEGMAYWLQFPSIQKFKDDAKLLEKAMSYLE